MAGQKISALDEVTAVAGADELVLVDKSDTGMAASGTDKRVTIDTLDDRWDQSTGFVSTADFALLAAVYHTILTTSGRVTTSGVTSKGYLIIPSQSDVIGESGDAGRINVNAAAASSLTGLRLRKADLMADELLAIGLTRELRLAVAVRGSNSAPGANVTFGLYPISISSGLLTLGTVVSGSTKTISSPSANTFNADVSAAFALPADGAYVLGYGLSGTPSANFTIQAAVQHRAV